MRLLGVPPMRNFQTLLIGIGICALAAATPSGQRAVPRSGSSDGGGASPQGARPAPSSQGDSRTPSGNSSQGDSRGASGSSSGGDPGAAAQGTGSTAVPYSRPNRTGPSQNVAVARPPIVQPGPPGGPNYGYGYPYYRYPYYYSYYPYYPYYPWGYGGFSFGVYYSGGYYGPWWYGYAPVAYGVPYVDSGAVRLKIQPNDATVWVDGYFAGRVDEFDGAFQKLKLEPGPHRIEVRANGYETLAFDVRVLYDRTITFTGDLKKF